MLERKKKNTRTWIRNAISRWDIFDVQSIAPFFNLENYGFPSHIDLLSFNTGTGKVIEGDEWSLCYPYSVKKNGFYDSYSACISYNVVSIANNLSPNTGAFLLAQVQLY